jgi:hypothetical protein
MDVLRETAKGFAMQRRVFVFSLVLTASLLVGLVACTSDEAGTPSPTPLPSLTGTSTATPTPTAPVTSLEDVRFDDADLQAVHDAIVSRNIDALAGLVEYQVVGCTHAQGAGGPPKCSASQAEGEQVRVFPIVSCEFGWSDAPLAALVDLVDSQRGLYAAVVAPAEDNLGWPKQDAYLVYYVERGGNPGAMRVHVGSGRIIALWSACGADTWDGVAASLAKYGDQELEFLVEPRPLGDAPGAVLAPMTGIEGVDQILDMVARYDYPALRERGLAGMAGIPTRGCVLKQNDAGDPLCIPVKGEQAGDQVPVFPLAYCEGDLARDPGPAILEVLNRVPVLHSVFEAPAEASGSELYPNGDYWLIYEFHSDEGGAPAVRLHVTESGELFVIWFGCGADATQLAERAGSPVAVTE